MNFIYSLLGAIAISLLSIIGIVFLSLQEKKLKKILFFFVSFSAGALLGGAFFHLIPEAIQEFDNPSLVFQYALLGIIFFFILEKFLEWHHCHNIDCEQHRHLGYLNLIGDSFHNLIDGIIIASAFSVNISLGVTVLVSIALHEIPQEIGDFGVLLYSGMKKSKALLLNFISALAVVMGVLIGYLLINSIGDINRVLLSLAAGGFLYISAADLIPELHKETDLKRSLISFVFFVLAILFMLAI